MDPRFPLAGFVVGTAVGLYGVGGNALLAPVLILLLGVPPTLAVGTDLAYSVPTKILACVLYARQKNVDRPVTAWLIAGGVPGTLAGLTSFYMLRAHIERSALEGGIRHATGTAILLACVGIAVNWIVKRLKPGEAAEGTSSQRPWTNRCHRRRGGRRRQLNVDRQRLGDPAALGFRPARFRATAPDWGGNRVCCVPCAARCGGARGLR